MIKIVLFFMLVFGALFVGIQAARKLTGQQAWRLTKLIGYSVACAALATVLLILFVALF
jgi:hypothetical protein